MTTSSMQERLPDMLVRAFGNEVEARLFSGEDGTELELFRSTCPDDRTVVQSLVGIDGTMLGVQVPTDRADAIRALLDSIARQVHDLDQLERDMESMYESSLAQMEGVARLGQVVQQISVCRTDQELASLAIESLAVAVSVERASFVRVLPQQGVCEIVVEYVPDPQTSDYRFDESRCGEPFHVAGGFLAEVLDGRATAIIPAEQAREEAVPGTPGSDVQDQLLAVPVRYGNAENRTTVGAIILSDPRANLYASARQFGSQEAELAINIGSMLGAAVGQRRFAAVDRELKLAKEIQHQILPQVPAHLDGFDLAGRCETPGAIGGDYFDFVPLHDGRLFVFIADVSGHNLASGMVMVGARSALRLLAGRESQPGAVLTGLHDAIYDDLSRTERFITAAGTALRADSGSLELVNAGHNPPLCFRAATGEVEELPGEDPILGLVPGISFEAQPLNLSHGDVLLLYTDGVTEAVAPDGTMFEEHRLAEVLGRSAHLSAADILNAVFTSVREFADQTEAGDDVTAVVIKYVGEASS
ncbi:MAG: SpoIIE family protein phosphatase [Planctomycetota bacterium]